MRNSVALILCLAITPGPGAAISESVVDRLKRALSYAGMYVGSMKIGAARIRVTGLTAQWNVFERKYSSSGVLQAEFVNSGKMVTATEFAPDGTALAITRYWCPDYKICALPANGPVENVLVAVADSGGATTDGSRAGGGSPGGGGDDEHNGDGDD